MGGVNLIEEEEKENKQQQPTIGKKGTLTEDRIKSLELLIKRSPHLNLSVVDGGQIMEKGPFLKLNALGVESQRSLRMAYKRERDLSVADKVLQQKQNKEGQEEQLYQLDQCTYFGTYTPQQKPPEEAIDENKLCDVGLPHGDGFGPRHFVIKYSSDMNCYFLRDLGEGSGTFIKV